MRAYENSQISSEFFPVNFLGGSASWSDMNAVLECLPESKICHLVISCNVCPVGYPTEDGKGMYQVNVQAALCMTTDSQHKEGAWAFLEYYLTREGEEYGMVGENFPTRRDLLLELIQEAATKRESVVEVDGRIITPLDMNGEPVLERKFTYAVSGEIFDCYYITEEQAEELLGMIESIDFKPRGGSKEEALQIIREELSDYQSCNKPLEEVTDIIQNRVALLLSE